MYKIGKVSYLNTLPLFYRFEDPELELVEGYPSELVGLLRKGEVQAGIVSSVEYMLHPELYHIIPDVSISSKERVCSVLLFSQKPLEEVKKVYITPASLTSRHLCFYLLEEIHKLKPIYTDEREGADALLLVGDEALKEKKRSTYAYAYDLAQEWHRVHKLPFVFALFLARKELSERIKNRIRELCLTSTASFFKDLKEGKVRVEGYSKEELEEYFKECINNALGEKETLSLKIFSKFIENRSQQKTT